LFGGPDDPADHLPRCSGHRNDELVDVVGIDNLGNLGQRPQHWPVTKPIAVLQPIVVNEADRFEPELGMPDKLLHDDLARRSCADDQGSSGVLPTSVARTPSEDADEKARGGHCSGGEERIDDQDRKRNPDGNQTEGGEDKRAQ
jgi:hypothetical protein